VNKKVRALVASVVVLAPAAWIACSDDDASPARPDGGATSSGGDSAVAQTDTGPAGGDAATADTGAGDKDGSPSDAGSTDAPAADTGIWVGPDAGISAKMSFFTTSRGMGKGGDLRATVADPDGLAGADAFCKQLANDVSPVLGAKTWRAYLGTTTVTPRSRIGAGPYYNALGVVVASSVAQLHDEGSMNLLSLTTTLDETGAQVPIAGPNQHDILTGANPDGTTAAGTCSDWTSAATNVPGHVGHSNRAGGGAIPTSWNSAHATQGCAESGPGSVRSGGGRGSFYCFALP
jgi:hypothetical protein